MGGHAPEGTVAVPAVRLSDDRVLRATTVWSAAIFGTPAVAMVTVACAQPV